MSSSGATLSGFNASGALYYANSGYVATLNVTTLSANQTITIPNASGTICLSSSNCNGGGANGGYIVNGTSAQTGNFNIQSASAGSVGAVIQGAASQTADLLDLKSSSGTVVANFTASGDLNLQGDSNFMQQVNGTSGTFFTNQGLNQYDIFANGCNGSPVFNSSQNCYSLSLSPAYGDIALHASTPTGNSLGNVAFLNYIGGEQIALALASNTGIVVEGASGQTGDLLQLQNSSGTVLSKFDANGNLSVGSSTSPTGGVAYFNGNVGIGTSSPSYNLDVQGASGERIKTTTNSTSAFQVQNASSASILNVDTSTTSNLITNGDFEGAGTTGWAAKGSSTISQTNTQAWQGAHSLVIATTTAANDGAQYSYTLAPSTQYSLSMYAKVASGTVTDINIGRQEQNGTDIDCLTGQTLTTTWTRLTCTFTTGATISGSNIYIKKTGTTAETFYIDGVQLQAGSTATAFNPGGAIQLNGVVNSPLTIQNTSNSTTAFQIQNAAGTSNLLVADTANTKLGVAVAPSSSGATLQVGGTISLSSLGSNGNDALCYSTTTELLSSCGSGAGSGNYILNGTTTQTANFNIQSASASSIGAIIQGATNQTADLLDLKSASGTVLESFTANGSVGIGTSSPLHALDVSFATTADNGIAIDNTDSGGQNYSLLVSGSGGGTCGSGNLCLRDATNGKVPITVQGSTGYVGIGTTTPSSPLQVLSSATNQLVLSADGSHNLDFSDKSNGDAAITGFTGSLYLGTYSNTNATTILSNGSLDVRGSYGANLLNVNTSANAVAVNGSFLSKSLVNSTTAFQIQNANGATILNTDTTNNGVTVTGGFNLAQVTAPGAPTVAVNATAGNLNGTYYYAITYVTPAGETNYGTASAAVSPANQQVNLTNIPVSSDPAVTARKIYRTVAGGGSGGPFYYVATLSDNTTTTYTDNTADGSLGAAATSFNTTGANLQVNGQRIFSINTAWPTDNMGLGVADLQSTTTGIRNLAVGDYALQGNTTGSSNIALGVRSLGSNTTGSNNTAIGFQDLWVNTTGYYNTALGFQALQSNTTAFDNAALGTNALYSNTTGIYNTATGANALQSNTTGIYNTATGANALQSNTTGNDNAALGTNALYSNTTGYNNAVLGNAALYSNTTGYNNAALGYEAGYTTVSANANTTGSNNTFLGYESGPGSATQLQNATAIGTNSVVNESNALVLGCINGTNGCTATTKVGIGTSTPSAVLTVQSGTDSATLGTQLMSSSESFPATTGWTSISGTGSSATATHTNGGGSTTLSPTPALSIVSGDRYEVVYTVNNPNAGSSLSVTMGGQSVAYYSFDSNSAGNNFTDDIVITASSTANLAFVPSNTFSGTITGVSVQQLTQNTAPALVVNNTSGSTSLAVQASSDYNTVLIGIGAGQSIVSGTNNTALGTNALQYTTSGSANTALGNTALQDNTSGANNTGVGYESLQYNTSGVDNTALGENSLSNNTIGAFNTAVGQSALQGNTTGSSDSALGAGALASLTTGTGDIGIGNYSGGTITTGNDNVLLGSSGTTTGSFNVGISGLQGNTTGSNNVAVGEWSLYNSTTGSNNVALGYQSLTNNINGTDNTGIGLQSLVSNTSGAYNVAVGESALQTNTTGSYNSALGYQADVGSGNLQNATAIGTDTVVNQSNAISIGCVSGVNNCAANSQVGIDTATPSATLDVAGNAVVQANSTNAFQVQNAAGTTTLLGVDTASQVVNVGSSTLYVTLGSQTFNYTGSTQTFTVPSGVTSIDVTLYGAQGGTGYGGGAGGAGGETTGTISVTPGEVLTIIAGGQGANGGGAGTSAAGGYGGGGGTGASGTGYSTSGGGGGMSAIETSGGTYLAIAGGGGGGATVYAYIGAVGGGLTGGTTSGVGRNGGGGTQTAGGSVTIGNICDTIDPTVGSADQGGIGGSGAGYSGGGGGGGYYGGGGGDCATASGVGTGGGGSALVPSGGSTISGVQSGNGQVTIQYNANPENEPLAVVNSVNKTVDIGVAGFSPDSQTFNYTGSTQTYTVPSGVTSIDVTLYGAQGGSAIGGNVGGEGGKTTGTISVTPGEVLTIITGGAGGNAAAGVGGTAGYGGGGSGNGSGTDAAGGGGGYSMIESGTTPLAIAAGGGGAGGGPGVDTGGTGGGTTGGNGSSADESSNIGYGGTQTAGGSSYSNFANGSYEQAGNGNYSGPGTCGGGGGGGGGYYGGGGGAACAGGGGGSALVPSGGTSTNGVNPGNGQVTIQYSGYAPIPLIAADSSKSTVTIQSNSASAFQVQDSSGNGVLNIGTSSGMNSSIMRIGASASNNISFYPNLGSLGYNNISQSGDMGLIFSGGSVNTGNLVIAPWANSAAGIRITNNGYVCIDIGTCSHALGVEGTGVASGGFSTGTPDMAEYIDASSNVVAQDVVIADPNNTEAVTTTTTPYDPAEVGVIANGTSGFQMLNAHYGQAFNALTNGIDSQAKPMTVAGRVPVKVTGEGGPIVPGDYLTTSSTSGYAMKADHAGPTIGKALGFFNGTSSSDTGSVLVLVTPGYYGGPDPTNYVQNGGNATLTDLTVTGTGDFANLNVSGPATLSSLTVTGSTSLASLTVTGSAQFDGNITVDGHIITAGGQPVATIQSAAGTSATAIVSGDDTTGTISITTGSSGLTAGDLVNIAFSKSYTAAPHIVISGDNGVSASSFMYPTGKTLTGFQLHMDSTPKPNTTYMFDYFIAQ